MKTDPAREDKDEYRQKTRIYVRAQNKEGRWGAYDIAELDKASLNEWLRSRGGDNPWAEEVVAVLLGHMKEG